jgi:hypothetical protein
VVPFEAIFLALLSPSAYPGSRRLSEKRAFAGRVGISEVIPMALSLSSITPRHLEEAQAQLSQADEAWQQYQYARVTPELLLKQETEVRRLADLLQAKKSEYVTLRNTWIEADAKATNLDRWYRFWTFWKSQSAPFVVGLASLLLALFLGVALGLVDVALGCLCAFLVFCLSSLVIAAWFYSKDDWTDEKIEGLVVPIREAKSRCEQLAAWTTRAKECASDLRKRWSDTSNYFRRLEHLKELANAHESARQRYNELQELIKGRKYALYHSNWRDMRGVAFEEFLQSVFEALGFIVETTKGSGDQGIDLIVTSQGGKIAVQAKGYSECVGNHAVMEAFAGMKYYNCNRCVVITNSDFTRHAKDLASRIGCRLIAGSEIPALIEGRMPC